MRSPRKEQRATSKRRASSGEVSRMMTIHDPMISIEGVIDRSGKTIELDFNSPSTLDDQIDDLLKIGGGNQGRIYAAKITFVNNNGEQKCRDYALKQTLKQKKRLSMTQEDQNDTARIIMEINQSIETSTQYNIIKLITQFETKRARYQLFPFCHLFLNRVLEQFQQRPELLNTPIHYGLILHFLSDMLTALKYLHDVGYVHSDIKPENIAFYRGHWCLIDLDSAGKTGSDETSAQGTPFYAHPGCFVNPKIYRNPKNDLHALGVVMKLLLGKITFPDINMSDYMSTQGKKYEKECKKEEVRARNAEDLLTKHGQHDFFTHSLPKREDCEASYEQQLLLMSKYLTQTSLHYIPDIEALIKWCNELKERFLSEFQPADELKKQLNDFYHSLSTQPFAKQNGHSAAPSLSLFHAPSHRLSLSTNAMTESDNSDCSDSESECA